jgi:hypothetical protein
MEPSRESEAGDLARRISQRRHELGLSSDELAQRCGVDPTFLEYFERHSDVQLGTGTLRAIAHVLQISPAALLGGIRGRPLGSADAVAGAILEPLSQAQCQAHLGAGGVGRVIFNALRGPVALPVNYRYAKGEVLFNTTVNASKELETEPKVGFEIDRIDDVFSEAWSVIVTGSARRLDHPDQLVEHALHGVAPWAGGHRGAVVAITAEEVTGRVIVHDATGDEAVGPNG